MMKLPMVLAALFAALPAHAQETPLGSHVRRPTAVAPGDMKLRDPQLLARTVMDQFGRCIMETRPRVTAIVIETSALGPSLWKQLEQHDLDGCLTSSGMGGVTLTMTSTALRGAVFKALYTRDHHDRAPEMSKSAPDGTPPPQPDWLADVATPTQPTADLVRAYVGVRQLAACVVLNKMDIVHRVLMAKPGSEVEKAAFAQLMPTISGCVPDGQELALSKGVVIGALAEVAHRMALPRS